MYMSMSIESVLEYEYRMSTHRVRALVHKYQCDYMYEYRKVYSSMNTV